MRKVKSFEKEPIPRRMCMISKEFEKVLSGDERSVWGDKAYPNQEKKRAARKRGIYYGVLDKATRRETRSCQRNNKSVISKIAFGESASKRGTPVWIHAEETKNHLSDSKEQIAKRSKIRYVVHNLQPESDNVFVKTADIKRRSCV